MMYRTILMKHSRNFNAIMNKGGVTATQDIAKGEFVVLKYERTCTPHIPKRPHEEAREIDRLAELAYEHALRN